MQYVEQPARIRETDLCVTMFQAFEQDFNVCFTLMEVAPYPFYATLRDQIYSKG